MTSPSLPGTLDEITPEWLTGALRDAGHLSGGRVGAVRARPVGEGSGFIGIVARLEIAYDGDAGAAPRTCIVKLPSADPGSRQVGQLYGLYEREVRFYADLGRDAGIDTPGCYLTAYDPDAGVSLILLEDLRAGAFGDQIGGCSPSQARLAVERLARLHARWWQSPRLGDLPWLGRGPDLVRGAMAMAYDACWEPCLARAGSLAPPALVAAGPTLGRRILAALDELPDRPLTLVHGDYRLDNLFFGAAADRPLTVCDWQSPNQGWASYDLTYFVTTSLPTPERRALEGELQRAYHQELLAGGARGYSLEDLELDYRRNLATMLGIFVINVAMLPAVNDRAVAMWEAVMARVITAVEDLDALSTLPAAP
jgi:hypothetical protein